jgi:hypothetical protein
VNPTVPLPVPFAPEVIVTHPALLVAVQLQPPPAATFTEPVPPFAAAVKVDDASEIEQPLPWVTVNVCPPAVMAALRDGPVFRAAENRTAA